MFKGFTDETFEFFMALRFNNNPEFFHANHDWYMKSVRLPLTELAAVLAETINEIDPDLERRPEKTVSRINRDLRFTKDKSPYRDYMWIGFHHTENKHGLPGFFADISDEGVGLGMGFYEENKPLMNAHREMLRKSPDSFTEALDSVGKDMPLSLRAYKRMPIPPEVPEELKIWYPVRNFSFYRQWRDYDITHSENLPRYIAAEFQKLAPLYRYFRTLVPIEQEADQSDRQGFPAERRSFEF